MKDCCEKNGRYDDGDDQRSVMLEKEKIEAVDEMIRTEGDNRIGNESGSRKGK